MGLQKRVCRTLWWPVVVIFSLLLAAPPTSAASHPPARLGCTFTAKYPVVLLRGGPGRSYEVKGFLREGDTFKVIDQAAGDNDGYVWWKGENGVWVRSDLGSSDCPATCGNTVCETGETVSSCAKDCGTARAGSLRSTGTGCLVETDQQCYESISCYPTCSDCRCWLNDFGCVTCSCEYPGEQKDTPSATGTGCNYASCEACIAAFPCSPGPCSKKECHLNEYGCPVCETAS